MSARQLGPTEAAIATLEPPRAGRWLFRVRAPDDAMVWEVWVIEGPAFTLTLARNELAAVLRERGTHGPCPEIRDVA